jgi:hypothetical protein
MSIHFGRIFHQIAPIVSTIFPVAAPFIAGAERILHIGEETPEEAAEHFTQPSIKVDMATHALRMAMGQAGQEYSDEEPFESPEDVEFLGHDEDLPLLGEEEL